MVQLVSDRFLVSLDPLRLLATAWPTSCRMQAELGRCRFGYIAVGGDDVEHYVRCSNVVQFLRGPRHLAPVWVLGDLVSVAVGVLPTSAAQVFASCACLHV